MIPLVCALLGIAAPPSTKLSNGALTATFDGPQLVSLGDGMNTVSVAGDSWAVAIVVQLSVPQPVNLSSSTCQFVDLTHGTTTSATFEWHCATSLAPPPRHIPLSFTVEAVYELRPAASFMSKVVSVRSSLPYSKNEGGYFTVNDVAPFGTSLLLSPVSSQQPAAMYTQMNPYATGLQIAQFVRWGAHGAFVSVANPYSSYGGAAAAQPAAVAVGASYTANMTHRASTLEGEAHAADVAVLGLTNLSRYELEGVNAGERAAFVRCVESFHTDTASRAKLGTVKVNVAWDESDYQIDAGTAAGRAEYQRIIDRNAEFGVTHIVYEPRNTRLSNRHNATDGWGWEGSLWLGYGERLRQGAWAPSATGVIDDSVREMVAYAASKQVMLLAYVYPCLLFEAQAQAFKSGALDLAADGVKEWLADTLVSFLAATGAAGYSWDHDIFAPQNSGLDPNNPDRYAQWKAWMQILAALRSAYPDIVMDHRQTAHMWGPWYHLSGSYAEPLAGDENPETYGVPIASLHADQVAADKTRSVNYIYAAKQLLPPSRVPGFIFHQTERTADNGTNPCFGDEALCFDNNTRDFDLLAYKYSLLSNVATAGQNSVLCMIPARDDAERLLLPAPDVAFIQEWIRFTDEHVEALAHTAPIATLGPPALGRVDGTHAMAADDSSGIVFLFNPSLMALNVSLRVDESLGISNASSAAAWDVLELFPLASGRGAWAHSEVVTLTVEAASALVLQLSMRALGTPSERASAEGRLPAEADAERALGQADQAPAQSFGGAVAANEAGGRASGSAHRGEVMEWRAARGVARSISVHARILHPVPAAVSVNGVDCRFDASSREAPGHAVDGTAQPAVPPPPSLVVSVRYGGGPAVQKAAPLGPLPPSNNTGGVFKLPFSVGAAVFKQLAARQVRAASWPSDGRPIAASPSTRCGLGSSASLLPREDSSELPALR